MRSVEDKEVSTTNFEFHKGGGSTTRSASSNHHHPRGAALGKSKATPSKWDDAQKWLVGLSRDKNSCSKTSKPRNSNADDTRLIAPVPHKEDDIDIAETKNVDCGEESYWETNNKTVDISSLEVRSVCVRDMGTEMTPIASQEPSRTATPIRSTTPVRRSPIVSGASTPIRPSMQQPKRTETVMTENHVNVMCNATDVQDVGNGRCNDPELEDKKINPLETRALAWDEAERAKYMARFKREEVKIQAWENHEKRKAEMEMKKMEVKADRMKARAQEKYANKLAATRRIAEEKRANAEAKLNENAVKTSEKADYIRRTGHLPSNLFKVPSFCW